MDRLLEMETFAAVADAGSFSGAADRMRMSAPAITRAISSLEDRLGVQLITRTTRRLNLTDEGVQFLDHTRRILLEIDHAEKDAVGETGIAQGHLTITASVTFGRFVITPLVRGFLQAYPKITATVTGLDRVANMVDEGIDVALRIGELPDSSLVARRVGFVRRLYVASPDYLARRGTPEHPNDLKHHSIIGFGGIAPTHEWHYKSATTKGQVTLSPRLEVNDASSALDTALAGEGITRAMSYLTCEHIRQGKLVSILNTYTNDEIPVHIVFPQARLMSPKLRAFLDFSADRLKEQLLNLKM
jgi:DNA-binding transcriptional LysR family regulator